MDQRAFKKSIEHEYNEKLEAFKTQQQKELEKLSKILEKKNYVSKVRFDAEFEIYRELSGTFFDLVLSQNDLFTTFSKFDSTPQDKTEYKNRFEEARQKYNLTMTCLHKNAPFIEKEFYEGFFAILKEAKIQLYFYPQYYIEDDCIEIRRDSKKHFDECSTRTITISKMMDDINFKLRDYLKSLNTVD